MRITLPVPNAPLVDIKTGMVTREWRQYFTRATADIESSSVASSLTGGGDSQGASAIDDESDIETIRNFLPPEEAIENVYLLPGDQEEQDLIPLLVGSSGAVTLQSDVTGSGEVDSGITTTVAKIQGTTVSGTTGTGSVVFSTSPTLVTPALGAPASGTLTNCAGLPATGISDYSTGSWTPAINFGGGTTGITYTRQAGHYVKMGRIVVCTLDILLSSKGSSTGNSALSGLPFTSHNDDYGYGGAGAVGWSGFSLLVGVPTLQVDRNATTGNFSEFGAAAAAAIDDTKWSNTTAIQITFVYVSAS